MKPEDVVFFNEDFRVSSWRNLDERYFRDRMHLPWVVFRTYTSGAGDRYAYVKPLADERPYPWCGHLFSRVEWLRIDPFLTASRRAVRHRWNWLRKIREFWYPLWVHWGK